MNMQNGDKSGGVFSFVFWAIFAAIAGPCFILLPSNIAYPPKPDPSVPTFMLWVVNVMNHPKPILTGLGLLGTGFLLGLAEPKLCWLLSLATQLPLTVGFLLVMAWGALTGQPVSQTPILIVLFGIMTIPPVYVGAVPGCLCRVFIFRRRKNSNQSLKATGEPAP